MKASEIGVGGHYVFVEGNGNYDQRSDKATRVKVLSQPKSGHVQVELLEDAKTRMGTGVWDQEGKPKKGDVRRVRTLQIWMPESLFVRRLENEATAKSARDKEEKRKADRLARIQERLHKIVPMMSPNSPDATWARYRDDGLVSLPTDQLERLLAAAEHGGAVEAVVEAGSTVECAGCGQFVCENCSTTDDDGCWCEYCTEQLNAEEER